MGSQGGGGTMSSSSVAKAQEAISGYDDTLAKLKREKVENLAKVIMGNVFKNKEPAK